MNSTKIRYPQTHQTEFFETVRARVNDYFKENQISKKGNTNLIIKGVISLAILLVPYGIIMTIQLPGWIMLFLCGMMGLGMSLVGTNIMHDACHGGYSKNRLVNSIAAGSMYLVGGNILVWQISHNVLHHSYTNIYGHDIDLETGNGIFRFTRHAEWKLNHRFQHIYAGFLYSLLTINWVFWGDFRKLRLFTRKGITYKSQNNAKENWVRLIFFKICSYMMWIVIPIMVLNLAVWKILLGLVVMHLVAGASLTLMFQLAHITEASDMPLPDNEGNMENSWAIHQLRTTSNWAVNNPFAVWYSGGLNFQIEHHLFPAINHIHYPQLAPIVKKTAREYGLPYHEYATFWQALRAHYRHLREMGRKPEER